MKKLILMTSALVLVGGAASAAITLDAEATLTYGNWDATAPAHFDQGTTLNATLEETTASGITYGASLTIEDLNSVTQGVFWVSGGFGKFSFGVDEFDAVASNLGNDSGDIQYEYSSGAITATLTAEAGLGNEIADADVTTNDWDLALAYAGGSWNLGLETDSTGWTEVTADTTIGNFMVGGAVDNASVWDVWASTKFGAINAKLTYNSATTTGIELDGMAGNVDWALTWNTLSEITASLDTTIGDVTLGVAYDSTNAGGTGDDAVTVVTFEYAAGDMLTLGLKANDVNEYEASVTAGFSF
jgi:hypothetical protein